MWALGMLVFEMLVGETPFASFSDMKQILNRLDTSGCVESAMPVCVLSVITARPSSRSDA